MEAKVFNPMNERVIQAWLARAPRKAIVCASVYPAHESGVDREIAVVLFVEERTVGRAEGRTSGARPRARRFGAQELNTIRASRGPR